MALDIDVSDPKKLTKDEILYLQDRDRLPAGVKPIAQEDREGGKTVLVAVPQGSATVPEDRVAEFTGHGQEDEDVVEVNSYDELSDTDLAAELKARGLSTAGKRETQIKRLEEDDAKS
jgi:hypothetical protein